MRFFFPMHCSHHDVTILVFDGIHYNLALYSFVQEAGCNPSGIFFFNFGCYFYKDQSIFKQSVLSTLLTALFFEFHELRIALGKGSDVSPSGFTLVQWLHTRGRENNEQIVEFLALSHHQDFCWFQTHTLHKSGL